LKVVQFTRKRTPRLDRVRMIINPLQGLPPGVACWPSELSSISFGSDSPQLAASRNSREVALNGEAFRSQDPPFGLLTPAFWILKTPLLCGGVVY
ncbi:MAG: hypothetical protein QF922_08765, partial [SAR324 cluster bacterium]|nr:hypothetical protein [SAR324 cluster bacterium]